MAAKLVENISAVTYKYSFENEMHYKDLSIYLITRDISNPCHFKMHIRISGILNT